MERLEEKYEMQDSAEIDDPAGSEDSIEETAVPTPVPEPTVKVNLNSSLRTVYNGQEKENKKRKSPGSGVEGKSGSKQQKTSEWSSYVTKPNVSYEDVGGLEKTLQEIRELVEPALLHPEIFEHLGVSAPTGVLLHGPPGCGKTLLVHAIAGELNVNFLKVAAPEIVSGMSGESEAKVRSLFEEAIKSQPCLLFLDEIDAITPKRENAGKEMERRIVAQLLNSMDELAITRAAVIVVGATNRPDSLDSALRRSGRFEREVLVGIPDEAARSRILQKLSSKMRLEGEFDFDEIARTTPGFVGADLASLTKEAASIAVRRVYQEITDASSRSDVSDKLKDMQEPLTEEQMAPLCVRMDDFIDAQKVIQPSSKREGFATIPDVSWEEIGGLETLQKQLHLSVVLPITSPKLFSSVGLSSPAGVLLFGPPGCGKTVNTHSMSSDF
jgi:ribosome biogenesis ATPase